MRLGVALKNKYVILTTVNVTFSYYMTAAIPTTLLAIDDPNFDSIMKLSNTNGGSSLAEVRVVSATGCENFAKMAYDEMTSIIDDMRIGDKITNSTTPINANIRLTSVEVFEHGANSAIYEG